MRGCCLSVALVSQMKPKMHTYYVLGRQHIMCDMKTNRYTYLLSAVFIIILYIIINGLHYSISDVSGRTQHQKLDDISVFRIIIMFCAHCSKMSSNCSSNSSINISTVVSLESNQRILDSIKISVHCVSYKADLQKYGNIRQQRKQKVYADSLTHQLI